MKIQKPAVAGTLESSDAQVTVEPGEGSLELDLSSSVMNQYGRQIKATVLETLERLGVTRRTGDRGGQGGPGLHPESPGGVRGVPQLRSVGAEYTLGRCGGDDSETQTGAVPAAPDHDVYERPEAGAHQGRLYLRL